MRGSGWVVVAAAVTLLVVMSACRTAPPPGAGSSGGAPGVVAKREGGAAELVDKVIIDLSCSDFATEQDQIVCITNNSDARVDVGEWLIRSALGRTFYFPPGIVIEPGKSLKVHTAAGSNDAENLYWSYEFKPVFDRKEQVVLISKGNVEIAKISTP